MSSSWMSMVEARLPPGFRFHPRDQELVLDYLCRKLSGRGAGGGVDMVDVDLNKCEPWELPGTICPFSSLAPRRSSNRLKPDKKKSRKRNGFARVRTGDLQCVRLT